MWLQLTLISVLSFCAGVSGYTTYLDFDKSCDDYNAYTIYDDDTYYIRWRGVKPKSYSSCSYKFSPYDTDYKVCVEAQSLSISDCTVKLQYYGGLIGTLLQRTYSCFDSTPGKFCGDTFDDVKVKLTSSSSSSSSSAGSFTLKVTTKNTYNAGIVAGAVVGGVVFAIFVVLVIIIVCRRRRLYPGTVVLGSGNQQTVTSTATSSYSAGFANQNFAAPPPYPGVDNSGKVMNSYPPPGTTGYNSAPYPGTGYNATGYSVNQSQPYPGN